MEVKPQLKDLQLYITLTYILLLLIGFLMDAIAYSLLGINIMAYSDVFDLLISPISLLVGSPYLFFVFGIVAVLFWGIDKLFTSKKWYQNLFGKSLYGENESDLFKSKVITIYGVVVGVFLVIGFSQGRALTQKIKDKDYKITHQIVFNDKEDLKVNIIGQNSQYVFYVVEGDDEVSISPIMANIKKIKKLKKAD